VVEYLVEFQGVAMVELMLYLQPVMEFAQVVHAQSGVDFDLIVQV